MLKWEMLHPDMTMDHLGFLPSFLSDADLRPAKEQLNDNYQHGGGWRSLQNFKLKDNNVLVYPGDSPFVPMAQLQFRHELIVFYSHDIVAIIQPDRSFEAARMD